MNSLIKNRKIINKIDKEIIKLLVKRIKCAKEIKNYKKRNKLKIIDKEREKEIFKAIEKQAEKYKIDKIFLKHVFKIIIKNSRNVQK